MGYTAKDMQGSEFNSPYRKEKNLRWKKFTVLLGDRSRLSEITLHLDLSGQYHEDANSRQVNA